MNEFEEQDYNKDFDIDTWKQLFSHIKEHKRNIIGLLSIFVLIAVIDVTFPLMTGYAIDTFIIAGDLATLPLFAAGYIGLVAVFSFAVFSMVHLAGRLETGITYTIRRVTFKKLQKLSYTFYDNTPVGFIMARITSDAGRLGSTFAWSIMDVVWSVMMIILMVSIMLFINVHLTLVAMAVMPVLLVVSNFFRKRMLKNQRDIRKENSKITAGFAEGINSARTTKTLVREEKNFEEFASITSNMHGMSIRSAVLASAFWPVILSMSTISVGLVLWRAGYLALMETISFGTLSIFIGFTQQMFEPIQQISRQFTDLQSAQASAERIVGLMDAEEEVVDSPEILEKYGDLLNPKMENWEPIIGDITFNNVSFNYKSGEHVLTDFNLSVKAGEKIALVGHTGAGKSTIVNLICRFYEPTAGEILIDGVNYKERSQIWLQSNLGYVLQAPHLFSSTIMENIRYGNLTATDEEIIQAAKTVNAYDFIMRLEEGFNTEVGEGGSKLSTGEKQLISFARAVLKDPKIFILDEATASIDTITEQVIQDAVDKTLEGRTSFIVAHRLSTIKSADRILVLEHGKIKEMGTHQELLNMKGHYHKLYTNQFAEESTAKILQ